MMDVAGGGVRIRFYCEVDPKAHSACRVDKHAVADYLDKFTSKF